MCIVSYQHLQTSTCSCSAPIRPCPDDDDLILGGAEEIIGDNQCQSTNATSEFQHLRADLPLARPRCKGNRPRKEPRGHLAYSKSSTSYSQAFGIGYRQTATGPDCASLTGTEPSRWLLRKRLRCSELSPAIPSSNSPPTPDQSDTPFRPKKDPTFSTHLHFTRREKTSFCPSHHH